MPWFFKEVHYPAAELFLGLGLQFRADEEYCQSQQR
jgi:hypothetical protein